MGFPVEEFGGYCAVTEISSLGSGNPLHCVNEFSPRHRRRECLAILFVEEDRFLYHLTEFGKYQFVVHSMATSIKQLGAAANEASIHIGPFNYFHILIGLFHYFNSSIASRTALSW
jgi:hypothetical protein